MKKKLIFSVLVLLLGAGIAACSNSSGETLLTQAEALFKEGKVKEGAKKIEEAYKVEPGNIKVLTAYAQVAMYMGKTNEAVAALDRGVKKATGDDLKQVASYRAFFLAKIGRLDEAKKLVAEGLKKWPGDKNFEYVKKQLATMAGAVAPAFTGTLINGGATSLAAYRGKVVLIDFWASWCGPCRKSMPHLKELYNKYRGKGLVVLGINLDKTKKAALDFMRKSGITFPVIYGDNNQKTSAAYNVRGIPATFLVDRKGVIRYSGHPMGLKEETLKSLL